MTRPRPTGPAAPSDERGAVRERWRSPAWRPSWFWRIVAIGAGGTLLTLLALGFLTLDTLRDRESIAERQAAASLRIVTAATQLQGDLTSQETGQRGYLLTEEDSYLRPYLRSADALEANIAALEAAVARSTLPEQRSSAAVAVQAAREKAAELAETIRLARAGEREAALALVRTDEGLAAMEVVQDEVAEIVAREEALIATARDRAALAGARVTFRLGVMAILMVGLIGVVGWLAFMAARDMTLAGALDRTMRERDRAELLRRELSHRVKNLFAVVIAMVAATLRETTDPGEGARRVRTRLQALGRAHSVSLGEAAVPRPDGGLAGVSLARLCAEIVAPYATDRRLEVEGDAVVSSDSVTPWGLVLNELATNALKYGGFADARGADGTARGDGVSVAISRDAPNGVDRLVWRERREGVVEPDGGSGGFGSILLQTALGQLAADLDRTWHPDGLEIVIASPHQD